jgi:hypothetical protein
MLALLAIIGMLVYGGAVIALFGREWLAAFPAQAPTGPIAPAFLGRLIWSIDNDG